MKYQISIINQSSAVSDAQIKALIPALQKQVSSHFAPAWGIDAKLTFTKKPRRGAMLVYIKDKSDSEGALGYHYTQEGLPVTYIFAVDDMADGQGIDGLSTTISHEIPEMLADSNANLYAEGFYYGDDGRKHHALVGYEVCDPVEADTYDIDGVKVSNFVFPSWFEPEHPAGTMKHDYLGKLDGPFQLSPGGYIDAIASGKIITVWGKEARRKKNRHRHAMRKRHRDPVREVLEGETIEE